MSEQEEKPVKKKRKKTQARPKKPTRSEGEFLSLADELGVEDLNRTFFHKDGREFAAAGRKTPVAEVGYDGLVMYSPDKPFSENAELEDIRVTCDEHGIVLNEIGERRKIAGTRYRGKPLYWIGETKAGTTRHLVAWFDEEWKSHKVFLDGEAMTTDIAFKVRSRTPDGELSIFPEITTEP